MSRLTLLVGVFLLACAVVESTHPRRCGSGPRAHSCITGMAQCQGGSCVCNGPKYVWGDGIFACYRKNTVAAEIKMDPMLTTFNNESIPFPFPCRYLVTHVKQQLKDRNRNVIGSCWFKVHSFNAKRKGKFYTHGFDVATRISYDNGSVVEMSSRHYGIARNGNYEFTSMGMMGHSNENGPWGNTIVGYEDRPNDIRVTVTQDPRNNHLLYELRKCGLRISFVPYDIYRRRNQVSQPGLSVGINCAMHPQWKSVDDVMALAPSWEGGSLLEDNLKPGLNAQQSMVVRAFGNRYEQNQPNDDNGQCSATSDALAGCSNWGRRKAFENCYWMLKTPRFIRCIDPSDSAKGILWLFSKCVDTWCGNTDCMEVKQRIMDRGCTNLPRLPIIPRFMSGAMCPP